MRDLFILFAPLLSAACGEAALDGLTFGAEPRVCRPADVAPGVLGIGDLSFAPDRVHSDVSFDPFGRAAIDLALDEDGAAALADLTGGRVGEVLDLSIDGDVVSSPIVRAPITGGRLQVTGDFSVAEAEAIAVRFAPPCAPTEK